MPKTNPDSLAAMRIKLENFRGIKDVSIGLHPKVTILVGKNGAGKTTILDAISLSLQSFNRAWQNATIRGANRKVTRSVQIEKEDIYSSVSEANIYMDFSAPFQDIFGNGSLRISTRSKISQSSTEYSNLFKTLETASSVFRKPLFVYYRQDRMFEMQSRRQAGSSSIQDELEGDLRAISHLETWWDQKDAEEARRVRDTSETDFRDPQLQAIRSLIQRVDSFKDIYYSYKSVNPGLYFRKNDNSIVHISKLSGGERSYIILLADLARRLQISYPELDLSEIPGIILIDEIELNLHPLWQSEIVQTLREIFKECQFIITTHSPQVISAVSKEHVRIIDNRGDGTVVVETPLSTRGRTSNYLLEGVFGATERFPEVDVAISKFNDAIDMRNEQAAKDLLDLIQRSVDGSPPDLLVLKKRLKKLMELGRQSEG